MVYVVTMVFWTQGGYRSRHSDPRVVTPSADYPLTDCVVSGKPLPAMSRRVAIVHEGTEVQFCCAHCIVHFDESPADYATRVREERK